MVNSQTASSPSTYSAELWFKSTSTTGGKLIGFGNAASGNSTKYDRQVVLLNNGRLQFGVNPGTRALAETTTAYNDGQWHHVVATQGATGMKLYVDSVLAASNAATGAQSNTGYWRVGGDTTFGGTSSNYVKATIDEVAVYASALPVERVEAHYAASGRQLPNKPPTAAFTHTESYLNVAVDGSASADKDGTIATYAWNFGDGTTAHGSHRAARLRRRWELPGDADGHRRPGGYGHHVAVGHRGQEPGADRRVHAHRVVPRPRGRRGRLHRPRRDTELLRVGLR